MAQAANRKKLEKLARAAEALGIVSDQQLLEALTAADEKCLEDLPPSVLEEEVRRRGLKKKGEG